MGVSMPAARRANPLQDMLSSCSKRQIAAAAFASGITAQRLEHAAIGRTTLDPVETQKVMNFLLRGVYMHKSDREGRADGRANLSGSETAARARRPAKVG
jgi:hypothetical protein